MGASREHHDTPVVKGKVTVSKSNSTTPAAGGKPTKAAKPAKPYPDFLAATLASTVAATPGGQEDKWRCRFFCFCDSR